MSLTRQTHVLRPAKANPSGLIQFEALPRQNFMFTPLARYGRGRHYMCMKRILPIAVLTLGALAVSAMQAAAQDQDIDIIPAAPEAEPPAAEAPDYSRLSAKAERAARLDDMFTRLKAAPNPEDANLVAEEIWAIWLESGSPSINLILRRGSDAQKKGKPAKARQMFDHVTSLSPDYAEGWARSGRLALEEKDYSRALVETTTALTMEPRHFYALWTMGNVFEKLGRGEEALAAYREANKLYPELKAVKEQLARLEAEIEGPAF